MEVTSCVKAVILAVNQYKNRPCDDSLLYLLRQLDVLISITNKGASLSFFYPKQLLPTECLACLVNLLNNPQTKSTLAQKTMTLLNNLANSPSIRESLHSTFDLTSILVNYFRECAALSLDSNAVLCIRLLQKITHRAKINSQHSYVEELVLFLIEQIEGKETELTTWCLGLLANLCRNNLFVKSFIKNQENTKSIYKKLMSYLSHRSQKVEIFAITIIGSLCLQDEIGRRIFNAHNINQTFQLLFNILHSGKPDMTQQYAVDLFVDIIKHDRIQHSLINYEHLDRCLQQVVSNLASSDAANCSMILELLLGFWVVPQLRNMVCKFIFESQVAQDRAMTSKLIANRWMSAPLFAIIHWTCLSFDIHETVSTLALEFLVKMLEVLLDTNLVAKLSPRLDLVLPAIVEILSSPVTQDGYAKKLVAKQLKATQFLKTCFRNDNVWHYVTENMHTKLFTGVLEYQLANNKISSNITLPVNTDTSDDFTEIGIDLAVHLVELLIRLFENGADEDETQTEALLVDSRLLPFLAFCMTSDSRERIQTALGVVMVASKYSKFLSNQLADAMSLMTCRSAKSSTCQDDATSSRVAGPSHSSTVSCSSSTANLSTVSSSSSIMLGRNKSTSPSNDLENSVQVLVEKVQNGLELKDVRASEIIGIYEHRLQTLQAKENHLQDLLDAKSLALSQSDRLMAQFRSRMAQYEAEGHKLRSLLQESERCKEDSHEHFVSLTGKNEVLQTELDHLGQENARLEEVAKKHHKLSQDYTEITQKLETCQRALTSLRQDHQSLTEMDDMLKRRHESLRQQHEIASKKLTELEEERTNLSVQIKDKDAKIYELDRGLVKSEELLRKKSNECDELEIAVDKLRSELAKTEQAKKELVHQVSSLEVVCRQREASIKEKDALILQQKTELDKHAQIAALIHNLSGGKVPATNA